MPRRNNRSQHQPFEFQSSCVSKRRFVSEAQATRAAEDQMLLTFNLELFVYKCELCGGWHITRRSNSV